MLIIGAKGFAKEILEILLQNNQLENLVFYDDVNIDIGDLLYERFPIVKNIEAAKKYFEEVDSKFTLGIGNPHLRKKLHEKYIEIGGELTSTISKKADIGSFGINIGTGCNILSGVKISNDVTIGKGTLIYYNSIITHDCKIGDFVEISPGATLLGRCIIGDNVQIGAGSIILPDVTIGKNSVIGAGAVVLKDIPENSVAIGVPAKIIKHLTPFQS